MSGSTQLGIYSSVTSPTLFIQVFISYLYAPLIPVIAEHYYKREITGINQIFRRFMLIISTIGLLAIIFLFFAGEKLLIIVFGNETGKYSFLLVPAVISTIATSLTWFFFAMLTALRRINILLFGSVFALLLSFFLSPILISKYDMNGVSYTYIFAQLAQIIVMMSVYFHTVRKNQLHISY
jgi:O-antigen/teichoic acid export membrane protein